MPASQLPQEEGRAMWDVMARADWHIFQVLTKRPERMAALVPELPRLPNVWLGVSIETDRWVGRADYLRATPAAIRFVSAEPLLGPLPSLDLAGIDWLIIGGESGRDFRPMRIEWQSNLVTRCNKFGVPVWVKQDSGRWPGQPGRLPPEIAHRRTFPLGLEPVERAAAKERDRAGGRRSGQSGAKSAPDSEKTG